MRQVLKWVSKYESEGFNKFKEKKKTQGHIEKCVRAAWRTWNFLFIKKTRKSASHQI